MSDTYSRIAIITGATSGIGEATTGKFIRAGFGVIGNGRNAAKLTALGKEFGAAFHGVAAGRYRRRQCWPGPGRIGQGCRPGGI